MIKFAIGYVLWVSLLFMLTFIEGVAPLFFVNEFQTQLTIQLTSMWVNFFQIPLVMQGDTLILEHGMSLQILHECNGLVPFLLYLAAILAYPTELKYKLQWFLIGYLFLMLINMVRIFAITLVVVDFPDLFTISHDWVGRYGVGLFTLLFFFWFTNRVPVIQEK